MKTQFFFEKKKQKRNKKKGGSGALNCSRVSSFQVPGNSDYGCRQNLDKGSVISVLQIVLVFQQYSAQAY